MECRLGRGYLYGVSPFIIPTEIARPQKNTVDYFPFYCEDGSKMFYIEETYGNDGFATFIKILKELARVEYHYLDLSKKSSVMFLSAKCKVSIEVLEAIISDLVMLEKFDSVLWNENKIIWCESFIESIQDAYAKRTNKCIDRNGLLHLLDSLGVRKLDKQKPKPAKGASKGYGKPQTILDDTILDESIEDESIEDNNLDVPTKVETPTKKKVLFTECSMLDFEPEKQKSFEIAKGFWQLFGANLKEIGAPLANINKADAKEWTRQIALMLKNKEATVEQLREVWDFLKVDEFWKPNVQSVPKLREKFTTIYSQSKKPKNGTNQSGGLSEEGKLRILEKLASGARFQEEQRQKHASQMHNE